VPQKIGNDAAGERQRRAVQSRTDAQGTAAGWFEGLFARIGENGMVAGADIHGRRMVSGADIHGRHMADGMIAAAGIISVGMLCASPNAGKGVSAAGIISGEVAAALWLLPKAASEKK